MKKEFYNILVNHSRYKRLVAIMSALVVGIVITMLVVSFKALDSRRAGLSPADYARQKQQVNQNAVLNVTFGILTITLMAGIAISKMKTRITTSNEGVEFITPFKKIYISWKDVKELKLVKTGTPYEKCRVKAGEKEIAFSAFFVEIDRNYQVDKNGIFDEHGKPVTPHVRKSRLYKEICRWTGKE